MIRKYELGPEKVSENFEDTENIASRFPTIILDLILGGPPEAIGQKIAQAMHRPTRIVLDQIKRARADEARLGYV